MSMKQKIIKGSIWNAISQIGTQGINFVIMILLAALLGPKNFGLIGMVTVITAFLGYFSEFGLTTAIVQKKDADELDFNTVYWSGIVLSIILYIIVFFSAPLIAQFYHEPQLTLITRVVFIDFLIKPYGATHYAYEIKDLNYDKLAKSQLVSESIGGIIAVSLAVLGYGVWSLVWQVLAKSFIFTIAVILQVAWAPKFQYSFTRFKKLFSYGIHIIANNLIRYTSENIDYLLIGKMLSPTALGIYTFAFKLSRYPAEKLWAVAGTTLFPAFATIQDEVERLRKNILRISIAGGLIVMPVLVLLMFGTEPVIKILGKKWLDSIHIMEPVIRIFIIYIFLLSISFGDETLMLAKNRVKILNVCKLISSTCLLVVGYFAIKNFDIYGMAVTYTLVSIIYTIIIKKIILGILGLNISTFIIRLRFLFYYIIIIFSVTSFYYIFVYKSINDIFYMFGAILIIGGIMLLTNIKYHIVDLRRRDIDVDKIL